MKIGQNIVVLLGIITMIALFAYLSDFSTRLDALEAEMELQREINQENIKFHDGCNVLTGRIFSKIYPDLVDKISDLLLPDPDTMPAVERILPYVDSLLGGEWKPFPHIIHIPPTELPEKGGPK